MGILRMIALVGFAAIVIIFVLSAGAAFMPGTKIGHIHGLTADELAGLPAQSSGKPRTLKDFAAGNFGDPPDAGMAPDAGAVAATPAGQGSVAPAEAQPLPEQQGR